MAHRTGVDCTWKVGTHTLSKQNGLDYEPINLDHAS